MATIPSATRHTPSSFTVARPPLPSRERSNLAPPPSTAPLSCATVKIVTIIQRETRMEAEGLRL
ncbi:ParA family protein [Sesbania bispinosa]|nr:ParA family protein [Sesbania bispinosa]